MDQLLTSNLTEGKLTGLPQFRIVDWGLIDYEKSNEQQQELVKQVHESGAPGQLIFCSHPPLVSVGRATRDSDVHSWSGPVLKTPRGGRATYHGPNQLVIYPIMNLNFSGYQNFKKRDVTTYLRTLEKVVIETLKEVGLDAYQRCEKIQHGDEQLEATGVWVNEKKIASIGVAIRRWVSYHGIAINLHDDPQAFSGINPCGFSSSIMTNVEKELGLPVDNELIKAIFTKSFKNYFS